jgi:hypothetical protein
MRWLALLFCLTFIQPIWADELATPDQSSPPAARSTDVPEIDAHPVLSPNAIWAGSALIAIVGLFVAAVVVGAVVRAEFPDEVPNAFSHAEDPSHHAGSEHSIWEEQHHP